MTTFSGSLGELASRRSRQSGLVCVATSPPSVGPSLSLPVHCNMLDSFFAEKQDTPPSRSRPLPILSQPTHPFKAEMGMTAASETFILSTCLLKASFMLSIGIAFSASCLFARTSVGIPSIRRSATIVSKHAQHSSILEGAVLSTTKHTAWHSL